MPARTVRFKQVDVFISVPFKGNPLAVVFDADQLDSAADAGHRALDEPVRNHVPAEADRTGGRLSRAHLPTRRTAVRGPPELGTAHARLESGDRRSTRDSPSRDAARDWSNSRSS